MAIFNKYQEMIDRNKTDDLSGSQPTKGNIRGGLTTIEEKALGNIQKIGKQCMVDGVLDIDPGPGGGSRGMLPVVSVATNFIVNDTGEPVATWVGRSHSVGRTCVSKSRGEIGVSRDKVRVVHRSSGSTRRQ